MTSLFSALHSATAGLRAVSANVKLVSDNISRADDPARTRHLVETKVDRSGFVVTAEYRRNIDNALMGQLTEAKARAGGSAVRDQYMERLGDTLRTTNGKPLVNTYADELAKAWRTLETSPESEVAQYQVVQAANNFAHEIRRVSGEVEAIGQDMRNDLSTLVKELNRKLGEIDEINDSIVSLRTQGASALEVADKRDLIIREVSELVDVRVLQRPDGRVALFTPTGLALVDATPANITFDGGKLNLVTGDKSTDITSHLQNGKLGALYNMIRDGSISDPPKAASADPTHEVIRKLRSQLDGLAQAFVGKTKPGEPTSFADAYNLATPAAAGEQDTQFFTGTDRFSIAVNKKLLEDISKIKQSAIAGVVSALGATGRNFTADGLVATDTSYTGMINAVTGFWMGTAKTIGDRATFDKDTQNLLEQRYHNTTGVSIDEEIAHLQTLQTSYAASARVMQVTNSMFDTLEAIVR